MARSERKRSAKHQKYRKEPVFFWYKYGYDTANSDKRDDEAERNRPENGAEGSDRENRDGKTGE